MALETSCGSLESSPTKPYHLYLAMIHLPPARYRNKPKSNTKKQRSTPKVPRSITSTKQYVIREAPRWHRWRWAPLDLNFISFGRLFPTRIPSWANALVPALTAGQSIFKVHTDALLSNQSAFNTGRTGSATPYGAAAHHLPYVLPGQFRE